MDRGTRHMSQPDAEATEHRRLDTRIAKLPYNLQELPRSHAEPFRKAGARTAYTFRDKKFIPIMYLSQRASRFAEFSTSWEKLHSTLIHGDGAGWAYPVVADDGLVIGHFGEFGSTDLYVPGNGGSLEALVERGVVFVDKQPGRRRSEEPTYSEMFQETHWQVRRAGYFARGQHEYGRPAGTQSRISVITDVNGYVVQVVSWRSIDGLVPVYYSPLDLVAIPKLVYLLGRTVAKKLVLTLVRRRAAKQAARGAAREIRALRGGEPPKLPIHGTPPQVITGRMGEPGNLRAMVYTKDGEVVYEVTHIVLKGPPDVVDIARRSHREMIRRAAQYAKDHGRKTFKFLGKQANANFREHADRLARNLGITGSGRSINSISGALRDYEVTLTVDKVLTPGAR